MNENRPPHQSDQSPDPLYYWCFLYKDMTALFVFSAHVKQLKKNVEIMKTEQDFDEPLEMLPEYQFNYANAKPNRFAQEGLTVAIDPDVAQVFKTSKAVNKALRAILTAIPKTVTYSQA